MKYDRCRDRLLCWGVPDLRKYVPSYPIPHSTHVHPKCVIVILITRTVALWDLSKYVVGGLSAIGVLVLVSDVITSLLALIITDPPALYHQPLAFFIIHKTLRLTQCMLLPNRYSTLLNNVTMRPCIARP